MFDRSSSFHFGNNYLFSFLLLFLYDMSRNRFFHASTGVNNRPMASLPARMPVRVRGGFTASHKASTNSSRKTVPVGRILYTAAINNIHNIETKKNININFFLNKKIYHFFVVLVLIVKKN